ACCASILFCPPPTRAAARFVSSSAIVDDIHLSQGAGIAYLPRVTGKGKCEVAKLRKTSLRTTLWA
ncbi:hypothetical protein, partial [Halomonas sp. ND22Bw]|uniref:hypothetical protein n=1 Tax=Halomonas sp. ND22Bw TaxID=2054178 RepID=UPI001C625911